MPAIHEDNAQELFYELLSRLKKLLNITTFLAHKLFMKF